VKSLSATHPDPGDELTRRLHLAYGFVVLEEFPDLRGPDVPALQSIKRVEP
jgi:hypothetical protein